jgi:hypothetical protein
MHSGCPRDDPPGAYNRWQAGGGLSNSSAGCRKCCGIRRFHSPYKIQELAKITIGIRFFLQNKVNDLNDITIRTIFF